MFRTFQASTVCLEGMLMKDCTHKKSLTGWIYKLYFVACIPDRIATRMRVVGKANPGGFFSTGEAVSNQL